MNEKIKNKINLIIKIFLLSQPILDILTGICVNTFKLNITIGVIVRILMLAFICYTTLFVFKKKKLLLPYTLVGIYFILYLIGMLIYKDSSLIIEIKNLLRVFYFPLLFVSLYSIKDEFRISHMTLFSVLFLYLILLFIPTLLGIGYKSYLITKEGTLGLFNSANEISGLISILTPIMFIIFYNSKKIIPIAITSVIYCVVILMIGTKTPLISLTITLVVTLIYVWIKWIKEKKYNNVLYSLGIVLIGIVSIMLILPKTNFYKNIRTHLDYLELEHVTDIFTDPFFVDHFIFSSRLEFLDTKSRLFINSSTYEKLFGIGYINNNKETKLIEMDYFDIYYSHGIIGAILFFSIIIIVLYKVLNKFKNKNYTDVMTTTSIFLIMLLSFFTGHILTAPSVSIISIIVIMSLAERKKKDLLFAAYHLDLGGIEKALLTLVNRIDYSKYNVDVVLEQKRGIFLNMVNKEVNVKELKVSENKDILLRKAINFTRKLIFKVLYDHTYDFSCCYATYSYSSVALALTASSNNSIFVHGDYTIAFKGKDEFYEFFDTRRIREFKNIIFVSNENKNKFVQRYKGLRSKCKVFNNFINTKELLDQSMEPIKEKHPKDKVLFVYIGRLDEYQKRITRQINLVKEIKNIELWLIGDGPDRELYEKLIKENKLEDRIKMLGRKSNPFPYMKLADYIILTSDYEGFPVTYLEAITLNKSIITTFPTSDELVDITKCGYIISMDEKIMVKEIKDILKEKSKKIDISLDEVQEKRLQKLYDLFNEK